MAEKTPNAVFMGMLLKQLGEIDPNFPVDKVVTLCRFISLHPVLFDDFWNYMSENITALQKDLEFLEEIHKLVPTQI